MTEPTAPSIDLAGLREKLLRKVEVGRTIGGGSISSDGTGKMWGNEPIMAYANPDGSAAADALLSAAEQNQELIERVAKLEAALRPFAGQNPHKREDGLHGILVPVTIKDVRRARAALTNTETRDD